MPFAARIALAVLGGGVAGYLFSRLLHREHNHSLTSNRPVMAVFGAILGVVAATVGLRYVEGAFAKSLVTPAEFQDKVIRADKPVVVDFYADWCGPCRTLMPTIDKLEREYKGKIVFYRVNVDEAAALAGQHQIRGIPTLLLYRKGKEVGRIVGGGPESYLRQYFDMLTSAPVARSSIRLRGG